MDARNTTLSEGEIQNLAVCTLSKLKTLTQVADNFTTDDIVLIGNILSKMGFLQSEFSIALLKLSIAYNEIALSDLALPAEVRVFAEHGFPIMQRLANNKEVRLTQLFKFICDKKVHFADVKTALNQILLTITK